ncbi:hypothetical protein COP2_007616 [Malus domestica]
MEEEGSSGAGENGGSRAVRLRLQLMVARNIRIHTVALIMMVSWVWSHRESNQYYWSCHIVTNAEIGVTKGAGTRCSLRREGRRLQRCL